MTTTRRVRLYALKKLAGLPLDAVVVSLRALGFNVLDGSSFVATDDVDALVAKLKAAPPPVVVDVHRPLSGRVIFVDGSNACMVGGTPRLAHLLAVLEALEKEGATPGHVKVLCDATLRHRLKERSPDEAALFDKGMGKHWHQVPAGVQADGQILLRMRVDPTSLVVSNDVFRRERDAGLAPANLDDRLLKMVALDDTLTLAFPRTWEVQPSAVVPVQDPAPAATPSLHA